MSTVDDSLYEPFEKEKPKPDLSFILRHQHGSAEEMELIAKTYQCHRTGAYAGECFFDVSFECIRNGRCMAENI